MGDDELLPSNANHCRAACDVGGGDRFLDRAAVLERYPTITTVATTVAKPMYARDLEGLQLASMAVQRALRLGHHIGLHSSICPRPGRDRRRSSRLRRRHDTRNRVTPAYSQHPSPVAIPPLHYLPMQCANGKLHAARQRLAGYAGRSHSAKTVAGQYGRGVAGW